MLLTESADTANSVFIAVFFIPGFLYTADAACKEMSIVIPYINYYAVIMFFAGAANRALGVFVTVLAPNPGSAAAAFLIVSIFLFTGDCTEGMSFTVPAYGAPAIFKDMIKCLFCAAYTALKLVPIVVPSGYCAETVVGTAFCCAGVGGVAAVTDCRFGTVLGAGGIVVGNVIGKAVAKLAVGNGADIGFLMANVAGGNFLGIYNTGCLGVRHVDREAVFTHTAFVGLGIGFVAAIALGRLRTIRRAGCVVIGNIIGKAVLMGTFAFRAVFTMFFLIEIAADSADYVMVVLINIDLAEAMHFGQAGTTSDT